MRGIIFVVIFCLIVPIPLESSTIKDHRDQRKLLKALSFQCVWRKAIRLGWDVNDFSNTTPHPSTSYIDSINHSQKNARLILPGAGGINLRVLPFTDGIVFSTIPKEMNVVSSNIVIHNIKTEPRSLSANKNFLRQDGFYATAGHHMNALAIFDDSFNMPIEEFDSWDQIIPSISSSIGKCYVTDTL